MSDDARGAIVTGAAGIAAATALELVARGWEVFVISVDEGECETLRAAAGPGLVGHAVADLRDERQALEAFAAARDALSGIDGVAAIAGGSARNVGDGWLHDMSLASWDAALALNLTTTFLTAREAVRAMHGRGGSLVLTSSVLARHPQPDNFATHGYAASKAAIAGWVVPLAAAYAPRDIRVNCVAPGLVATPGARRAAQSPRIRAFAARKQPVSRGLVAPEDVASTIAATLENRAMTGQVIEVDGGWGVTSTS